MNERDMVYVLQDQLHTLFGNTIYDIATVDLLAYLNKSQTQLVKEKLQDFERTQYITDELRTLVIDANLGPTVVGTTTEITLPENYNVLVKHEVTVSSNCGTIKVPGLISKLEYIGKMLQDPFWKPIAEEPLYYIIGNKIIYEIPDNNFNIVSTKITYIKKEAQITISDVNGTVDIASELPSFLHEEIVSRARELIISDKQLNNK